MLAALGWAAAVAGCSKSSSAATTPTTTTTTTTTSSVAGCEPGPTTPGGPVGMGNGPYAHNIAFGFAADGVTVTGMTEVLAHASVPDGVRLPDGSIGVYYVNGETDGVWLARLNGTTLTPVSAITVDGILRPTGVVDPDATNVGGKVRLAYLNGFNSSSGRTMCLAESSDGVTFKTLAAAWTLGSGATQTDPSLLQLTDGSWLMAISSGQQTWLGRSSSGLSFTQFATMTGGGVPELAATADGRVRLYVCSAGIVSYVSSDAGTTWTREATVVPQGTLGRQILCDPSFVPGAGLFIFKTQ